MNQTLTVNQIAATAERIAPHVLRTPTVRYVGSAIPEMANAELFVKLELLQRTGSFKARGAINNMLSIDSPEAGVTAFSAGNHAIAVAYAAQVLGRSAKVVMPKTANPLRVARCQQWGAEVMFGDDISSLVAIVDQLQREEQRVFVHPFEGMQTIEGTSTVGFELCTDVPNLDVVVVPIGGGGLISGIAAAVKLLQPQCLVIGVEPVQAQGMAQSLAQGKPMDKVEVSTIADSLGAPMHLPISYSFVERYVDELVQVTDDEIRMGMRHLFDELRLAVEPACAATLAALHGPLKGRFESKRVGILACGSNIDMASYFRLLQG